MPVAVHRFDTLAPKTVFMPGGLPTAGFHGFAQSGGSLLPGVKLEDYISQETEELFVPTMALAQDLTQFSVRMALMDNRTETGTHFSVCSAEGATGWSPFLPNKFASSVLEPLRAQQQAKWTFASFWSKYLPQVQMPERVMAAHGAVFSLSRDSIRSHPKSYYERLLAELEGSKDPYQAFYLEHMWWYIFHPTAKAPCGADVVAPETRVAASRSLGDKRRLAEIITVLDPRAGDVIEFGSTQQLSWTSTHNGYFRVELWRYGSFSTRMYDSKFLYAGSTATVNWNVYPGPSADDAPDVYPDSTTSCVDQTDYLDAYGYSCADWSLPVGDYWGPNGYGVADGSRCGLANLQYAIDPYVGGYTADQMAQIRAACPATCGMCSGPATTTSWCHDDLAYVDDTGHNCEFWGSDLNSDGNIDCSFDDAYYVANGTSCDSLAAPSGNVTDNYYPCETGGYGPMTSSTMGTFYYPKFFMDEVRSRCPFTCGTCASETFPG